MYIIAIIMFIVPALIGVLFYERFKGYELILRKRIELTSAFSLVINIITYAAFWIRGWHQIILVDIVDSHMSSPAFVMQYMAIALIVSIILAYVISLVRISKSIDAVYNEKVKNADEKEDTADVQRTDAAHEEATSAD